MLSTTTDLISTDELAALLGVKRATLHSWRHFGIGPESFRVGNRVRYRREAVEQWLEAQDAKTRRGDEVVVAG